MLPGVSSRTIALLETPGSLRDFYIMTLIIGLGCSAIARLALRMIAIKPLSFFLDRKDIILSKDLENATDEGNSFYFLSKDWLSQLDNFCFFLVGYTMRTDLLN